MKSKNNKIIVFANQKGGVGKSTLCILLANYLSYWKKDVCIIDTDLQQSASLQREQDRLTFGEEEPYSIQSFEVSDLSRMTDWHRCSSMLTTSSVRMSTSRSH